MKNLQVGFYMETGFAMSATWQRSQQKTGTLPMTQVPEVRSRKIS